MGSPRRVERAKTAILLAILLVVMWCTAGAVSPFNGGQRRESIGGVLAAKEKIRSAILFPHIRLLESRLDSRGYSVKGSVPLRRIPTAKLSRKPFHHYRSVSSARKNNPSDHRADIAPARQRPQRFNKFTGMFSSNVPSSTWNDSLVRVWVAQYTSGLVPSEDVAVDMVIDIFGNLYITGYSTGSLSGADYLTIKYSSQGQVLWTARYDNGGDDFASALAVDSAGNVYVSGASWGPEAAMDYATVKYNAAGAQQWVARYDASPGGEDWANDVAVGPTSSGGSVYVTGTSQNSSGNWDYVTVKYNSSGTLLWSSRYDGAGNDDNASAIAVDHMGSVYVTGSSVIDSTSYDYATIKYNAFGVQQWLMRYDGPARGDDFAVTIGIDSSANVYVTGSSEGIETGADFATIKYNSGGVQQWTHRYNGVAGGWDVPASLSVDRAGNVVVTGASDGLDGTSDFVTVKYTSPGAVRWTARYSGPISGDDAATAVCLDAAGNAYVTGWSNDGLGTSDYATLKYNTTGVLQWAVRTNGPGNAWDWPQAIAVDPASNGGGVYVTGYMIGLSTSSDYGTIKLNSAGVQQWQMFYDGPGSSEDTPTAIAMDATGNVYVTGYSRNANQDLDYATVKYNSSGIQQWAVRYDGSAGLDDIPTAIAVDASGNVYVTGASEDVSSSFDYATIKYSASGSVLWVVRYNSPNNSDDMASALAIDEHSNVYVTGNSWGPATSYDYVTVKYNALGILEWVAHYDNEVAGDDRAVAIATDANGYVYITGSSWGIGSGDDFATIKYSSTGGLIWVARYNAPGNYDDEASALALDDSGNVYVAGSSWFSGSSNDYTTVKYDSSGNMRWAVQYNGDSNDDDVPVAIAHDGIGGVVVTGWSVGASGTFDYATVRYGASGEQLWVARYDSPEHSDEVPSALCVDGGGNVYITGSITDGVSFADFLTVKYTPRGVLRWSDRYQGPGDTFNGALAIATDGRGDICVTGFSLRADASVYTTVRYRETSPAFFPSRRAIFFGDVATSCRRTDSLVVRNPRASTLTISSIGLHSQHFFYSPRSATIAPFDSAKFYVVFAPLGVGYKSANLIFQHNGSSTPDTVVLRGIGGVPPNGVVITPEYESGWQLISLPLVTPCLMIIPAGAYEFHSSLGYIRRDTLGRGKGYWTKMTSTDLSFAGTGLFVDSISVRQGWNIIGSISASVDTASIITIPPGLRVSNYYGYRRGYVSSSSIEPGKAYWVKAAANGTFILGIGSRSTSAQGNGSESVQQDFVLETFNQLSIQDNNGGNQTLYFDDFGDGAPHLPSLDMYELPPPGPEGVFDARFESQRMVEILRPDSRGAREAIVLVRAAAAPLTIAWNIAFGKTFVLQIGSRGKWLSEIPMCGNGKVALANVEVDRLRLVSKSDEAPIQFSLSQNYPNPFNSSTRIRFGLPRTAQVKLHVFNVLGQTIAELVSGELIPGYYDFVWEGKNSLGVDVGSGAYWYRVKAEPTDGTPAFISTRPMLLLR